MCVSRLLKKKTTTRLGVPRERWLIGSVHGTPKLTIKKLRTDGFAQTAQFITTKLYSLMVLFW